MRIIDENGDDDSAIWKMGNKKRKRQNVKSANGGTETPNRSSVSIGEEIDEDIVTVAAAELEDVDSVIVATDDKGDGGSMPKKCSHVKNSTSSTLIRDKLKDAGFSLACEECAKSESVDENDSVWICLRCGHRGCGRYSTNQHAKKHYEVPRSDRHSLAYCFSSTQIWCYECDNEVSLASSSQQLRQLVGDIQKKTKTVGEQVENRSQKKITEKSNNEAEKTQNNNKGAKMRESSVASAVKGLSNLGNTCFFNSVVQNLMQTHQLDEILESERLKKGASFVLKPSPPNAGDVSPNEEHHKHNNDIYVPITVTLNDDPGPLTSSLRLFLNEFKTSRSSIITPSGLFTQVCKKAPRFRGFQQQDSHELLRYLLDALRDEERRRLRLALLTAFNFPNASAKPDDLTAAEKQRLKAYDKAADFTCVEQVFGGQLIQCIKCLECKQESIKYEHFLDLSLPIVEAKSGFNAQSIVNKMAEPFSLAASSAKKSNSVNGVGAGNKSKHLQKKEKKVARKQAKGQTDTARRKLSSTSESANVAGDDGEKSTSPSPVVDEDAKTQGEASPTKALIDGMNKLAMVDDDEDVEGEEVDNIDDNQVCKDDNPKSNVGGNTNEDSDVIGDCCPNRMEPISCFKQVFASKSSFGADCHVANCLREFMAVETLCGKNQFGCEYCSKRAQRKIDDSMTNGEISALSSAKNKSKTVFTDATKQYLIFSPPAVLTLHLKRFHQMGGSFRKISKHVEFPLILDLAPFCKKDGKRTNANQTRILYSLYGVVCHSGRLTGGHYVAYVKVRERSKNNSFLQSGPSQSSPTNLDFNKNEIVDAKNASDEQTQSKWYYISDSHVSETAENKVLNAEAYLLFYERTF